MVVIGLNGLYISFYEFLLQFRMLKFWTYHFQGGHITEKTYKMALFRLKTYKTGLFVKNL